MTWIINRWRTNIIKEITLITTELSTCILEINLQEEICYDEYDQYNQKEENAIYDFHHRRHHHGHTFACSPQAHKNHCIQQKYLHFHELWLSLQPTHYPLLLLSFYFINNDNSNEENQPTEVTSSFSRLFRRKSKSPNRYPLAIILIDYPHWLSSLTILIDDPYHIFIILLSIQGNG